MFISCRIELNCNYKAFFSLSRKRTCTGLPSLGLVEAFATRLSLCVPIHSDLASSRTHSHCFYDSVYIFCSFFWSVTLESSSVFTVFIFLIFYIFLPLFDELLSLAGVHVETYVDDEPHKCFLCHIWPWLFWKVNAGEVVGLVLVLLFPVARCRHSRLRRMEST